MELGAELGLPVPADPGQFRREWMIARPLATLQEALRCFVNIQSIWCDEGAIERLTREAVEDAEAQGIRILELRYSPDFIRNGHAHLNFDKIHNAILRGLGNVDDSRIAVGLIGIVQKTLSIKDAAYTTDFIIENRDSFVALDFADQDTHDLAAYRPMVDKARAAGLRLTTHAGEENSPDAPQHVLDAIETLGTERVGHGIHIIDEQAVMDVVIGRRIPLEVCPTSNWLTNAVPSTAAHPVRRLLDAGVPLTINSDDPGLFGIDLCHEYRVLEQEHGFGEKEFDACNDLAASCSFIPVEKKQKAWPRPIEEMS
jgi:adenosine deaminase